MSTPAPGYSASRREANGREANGREANGSTPRVMVTRGSLPRGGLGSTATRLFRDPWNPRDFLHSQVSDLKNMQLWRAAILEAVFTGMWVLASLLIVSESVNWGTHLPGRTILVAAFLHVVMFFIYIVTAVTLSGKESGDPQVAFPNLNPAITLMQMLSGAQGLVGGLLFIIFQCVGAILAALAAKEILPQDRIDLFLLGGCFGKRTIHLPNGLAIETGFSSTHKYFLAEFIFAFTFLYTTAMLFAPRKLKALGLTLAVFLMSLNIGFNVYLGTSIRNGYSGSMFNPARCLGSAVAYGQPLWDRLWPPFVAPFVASFAVAFLFATVPPDHAEVYAKKKDVISQFRKWSERPSRRGDDFEAGSSPSLDDPALENNTVYEVPSAGRLFSASPETPGARPPPEPAHAV